jgi:threonine dehydratase
MRFFSARMKMVVEPTGCLGFTALRDMRSKWQGKRVGVLVSGGKVDVERYCALLTA